MSWDRKAYFRQRYRLRRKELQAQERARYWKNRARIIEYKHRPEIRERDQQLQREGRSLCYKLRFLSRLEATVKAIKQAVAPAQARAVTEMSTSELVAEFDQGWRLIREQLVRQADLLAELEARGCQVAGDRHMLALLRSIKGGQLLAEIVVRFAGTPQTMARLQKLGPALQRQALDMEDADVERLTGSRGKKTDRRSSSFKPTAGGPLPLQVMASHASPRDCAEMVMILVDNSRDPAAVAAILLPDLEKILASRTSRRA